MTRDALEHVRALPKKHHQLILRVLRSDLAGDPTTETHNLKRLTLPAPFAAHFELRFGPQNCFRAFFQIDGDTVLVVAVGVKERERLRIGKLEVSSHESRIHRRGQGKAK